MQDVSRLLQPRSALIADDQDAFRRAAHLLLVEAGFDVVGEAATGEDAVRIAAELSPSLVMLDILMPGLDGIAAARQIRMRDSGAVIVLITARDVEDLPSRATDVEVHAIISKSDLTPRLVRELWDDAKQVR